jgi:hypothetical protein
MLARMRLKSQYRKWYLGARRVGRPDDLSVAAMDTIEVAECDSGAARIPRQVAPVVEDLHQARDGT